MSHWCGTCEDIGSLLKLFTEHVEKMSPREKAELRVQMRQQFRQPPQPEPLLDALDLFEKMKSEDAKKIQ
jgi:hypothetical protein